MEKLRMSMQTQSGAKYQLPVTGKSSGARLKSVFETMTDGLIVINSRGLIEDLNPATARLFGYEADDMRGQNVSMLMPSSLAGMHDAHIESYLATGTKSIIGAGREVECRHKDGSLFHAHLSVAEFFEGGKRYFTGIIHNISERIAMESRLKEAMLNADRASTAKSEFLANMSHEIRTPLNGVMGMLELLKETELDPRQNKYVATAYSSATSLLNVISSVLDFSKIESGSLNIRNTALDIRQVVGSSVQQATIDAPNKGLECHCIVAPEVPHDLLGDAMHLEQIIFNLVSNSVKFTDTGNINVRVSLKELTDSKVRLFVEVEDSGIGIAEDKLSSLFEPFTQGDSSSTRKYGGTGLGLTIAKRLIELMGGEIGVISTEGRGTTFWFSLWLEINKSAVFADGDSSNRDDAVEQAEQDVDPVAPSQNRVKKILIVDDILTNRRVCKAMINKLGFEADLATNGSEALAAIAVNQYDLVLMDCQMPVMDGYEAARLIRDLETESKQANRIPIVALTAHALERDREASIAAGMDDYMTKPVSLADLESIIQRWVV